MTRLPSVLLVASVLASVVPHPVLAQGGEGETTRSVLWQPSMNVFRRFAADRERMTDFYGKVLGLRPMAPLAMPGGGQMIRFQVGTSEIKLQATPAAREYPSGPVSSVTGLRVLTFFFPDEAALAVRFREQGYPVPEFRDVPGGRRVAMVRDPEDQWVELVVVPGAPPEVFDRIEVGLTVSNLDRSRAFYRDFVGLDELPPVHDPILGVMKYPYRHGTTTVNLWSFGAGLPANTRTAGIQYVVSDVDRVDELARARRVTIDQPLGGFGASLRTIWLADPDGVTNYFAETAQSRAARQ